jgi:pimeloyl-ACP methyl ester carboxylesterase
MTSAASRARDRVLNERVKTMMLRQPGPGVAAALRGMAERPDRSDGLAALPMRTLVITGSDDTLIPPAEAAAIAEAVPHGRLVTIPGAGHLTPLENPVLFNAAVRAFLSRLPG